MCYTLGLCGKVINMPRNNPAFFNAGWLGGNRKGSMVMAYALYQAAAECVGGVIEMLSIEQLLFDIQIVVQ